jgi:hypothetical protein
VDDERGLENRALHKWYSYNWTTHIVKSKHHTYALWSATGETVLLTFLSYCCDDGSPGCVTLQYVSPTSAQRPPTARTGSVGRTRLGI